jgi:hypothetical protein
VDLIRAPMQDITNPPYPWGTFLSGETDTR